MAYDLCIYKIQKKSVQKYQVAKHEFEHKISLEYDV